MASTQKEHKTGKNLSNWINKKALKMYMELFTEGVEAIAIKAAELGKRGRGRSLSVTMFKEI